MNYFEPLPVTGNIFFGSLQVWWPATINYSFLPSPLC